MQVLSKIVCDPLLPPLHPVQSVDLLFSQQQWDCGPQKRQAAETEGP